MNHNLKDYTKEPDESGRELFGMGQAVWFCIGDDCYDATVVKDTGGIDVLLDLGGGVTYPVWAHLINKRGESND